MFLISNKIESFKNFKESSYSICENLCFSPNKMFFAYNFFLKQLSTKSSVTVDMKVVCLHLLRQKADF